MRFHPRRHRLERRRFRRSRPSAMRRRHRRLVRRIRRRLQRRRCRPRCHRTCCRPRHSRRRSPCFRRQRRFLRTLGCHRSRYRRCRPSRCYLRTAKASHCRRRRPGREGKVGKAPRPLRRCVHCPANVGDLEEPVVERDFSVFSFFGSLDTSWVGNFAKAEQRGTVLRHGPDEINT